MGEAILADKIRLPDGTPIDELATEVLGGPFPEAILLMEGERGTKVWVNESRTVARIEYSDGLVAHGLMIVIKEANDG